MRLIILIAPTLVSLLLLLNACSPDRSGDTTAEESIRPYVENPFYWQYRGEPVLLLGASDEDNLFNHPDIWPYGLESHLDLMVYYGGNYVRNTMSSRDHSNEWPFGTAEGGLYDLETWNDTYWDQFETFLQLTHERDIIVQIELWDRFDYAREPWNLNPFNPRNNINYTSDEIGLPQSIETHPGQRENPFFRTPPDFEDNSQLLRYQQALVEKLFSISLDYPHILYCISNETNESPLWSDYWAHYVKDLAAEKGVDIHVTEMWDAWDLSDPEHDATFNKPELYTYVDISQNTHQQGQTHWDNARKVFNERLFDQPRPVNSVKIYGGLRHGGGFEEGVHKFWRNVLAGLASSRFHRSSDPFTPSGLGLSPLAQSQLLSMRMFISTLDIFSSQPANHLLTHRDENEAYATAIEGEQYGIYFTSGGQVGLDLQSVDGVFSLRWLDVLHSEWLESSTIEAGETVMLEAPGTGPWAVVLTRP